MKKKKWIRIIGIVGAIVLLCAVGFIAVLGVMSAKGYGISTGRFYTNDFGIYLVDEGEAMIMSDQSKNQDVFENLSVGDLILVVHDGINETYPAQTGAYRIFRISKGNESDLPETLDVGVAQLPSKGGDKNESNVNGSGQISTDDVDIDILKNMTKVDFEAQYIRTDGYHEEIEYPVVKIIRSVDELNSYYEENKELYSLERRENPASDSTIGFLDACDKYDAAYFEKQILIMVLLEEGSGSNRHEVKQAGFYGEDENKMMIDITSLIPEVGTCDMALWHILVEPEAGIDVSGEEAVKIFLDGENVTVADRPTIVTYNKPYANITLSIPNGWKYEIDAPENDENVLNDFCIAFWPEEDSNGKINVWYLTSFGVCGTGLKTEEIQVGSYQASQGTYEERDVWDYIYFKDTSPGAYVAQTEWSEEWWIENGHKSMNAWWETYGDEIMQILATVKLGEDILTEEEAVEVAKLKCNIEYDQTRAEFDDEKVLGPCIFIRKKMRMEIILQAEICKWSWKPMEILLI